MQPTINVNLKSCDCDAIPDHAGWCSSTPVLLPCPIHRSVTFEVRLVECTCGNVVASGVWMRGAHHPSCPARPVRVSCSISGATWEDSEVVDPDLDVPEIERMRHPMMDSRALSACRERWALVKALVLGRDPAEPEVPVTAAQGLLALFQQRDAVFSALAKRVRSEDAGDEAMAEFFSEVPPSVQVDVGHHIQPRLSEHALARYVENLVEQVGVLE